MVPKPARVTCHAAYGGCFGVTASTCALAFTAETEGSAMLCCTCCMSYSRYLSWCPEVTRNADFYLLLSTKLTAGLLHI
jgi:hypothetical protein